MKNYIILLVSIFTLTGCSKVSQQASDAVDATTGLGAVKQKIEADVDLAQVQCINLCKSELARGTDLSDGPCLGNPIAGISDWVCDVAHNPRQDVDSNSDNQCSAFRERTSRHFVEVDENCGFIRSR